VKLKDKYTLDYIRENGLILLEVISGSTSYGTNVSTSDKDIRGLFYMEQDDLLGLEYVEQINDSTNDTVFFELGRYIQLLLTNNPNILELLASPEDCIIYRHPIMDMIKQADFLSKLCKGSFGGYATEQIRKAKGLSKKIVTPMEPEKKTPMDFCYVIKGSKSQPLRDWLEQENLDQLFCGLVAIEHARETYALFYDLTGHNCFSPRISEESRERLKTHLKNKGEKVGLGYKGIEVTQSNAIRVSSVDKEETPLINLSYNKDGYTVYCKQYKEYWDWFEKRNQERFDISSKSGYNQKNMLHCFRLTEMSKEIASGQGVIVRRPNREFLLKIRNGEMEYEVLLDIAEKNLAEADKLFDKSNLQDQPSFEKANELLVNMRKILYNCEGD